MKILLRIAYQVILITVVGVILGFSVNALSEKPLSLTYTPPRAEEKYPVVDYETAKDYADQGMAIFIDARDPSEFKAGHIEGAVNIPASRFGEYFEMNGEALPREGIPLIVYCQGDPCEQSHIVLDNMKMMGFENLHIYLGGWNDWKQQQS